MKKTLITLLCILSTLSIFAQNKITLEDIWSKGTFRAKAISEIRSMNNGENYCILTSSSIDKYEYKTGNKVGTIVDFSTLRFSDDLTVHVISDYNFSADEKMILLSVNPEFIYRHSYIADYYIYNTESKEFYPLSKNGKQRLAEFSPNGQKIAFVRNNNLFVYDMKSKSESQITKDGKINHIINGTTDWVYEEEFGITKGFYWNAASNKIAYYRFDESKVKEVSMTMFGNLYTDEYKFKYPKAGEDNSVVDIYVYDLGSNKHTPVNIGLNKEDIYIPIIQWTKDENILCLHRLNRFQNQYEIFTANTNSKSESISLNKAYEERNKYFVELPEPATFLDDKENFIIKSERSGFWNLYMVNLKNKSINPITNNKFDVEKICFIDEKGKKVYYTAAESSAFNRELCVVDFNSKNKKTISKQLGTNEAQFSKSGKYYINNFCDANTPNIYTINNQSGDILFTLEDNKGLRNTLTQYGHEKKEFGNIKIPTSTKDSTEINYWMIKPSKMEAGKKYPVLFFVYGGPGSQEVLNSTRRFSDYMWYKMLAQEGYITICIDTRGTGMKGEEFKKCTYMQLGKYETDDVIEAATYFGAQEYVDKSRIGIFGWSYGGYMSSLCITKGADVFKSAIAVAPVTTWRYYNTIYTERYMRTPQVNPSGYDDNSPINHAEKLKGKYLLIHGTADDNVHFQNAMDMSTALINANKQFEQFSYPNKNHGIYGGNTRIHLYNMMTDFIKRNL